ncbi:MAG: hypothetical protein KIT22_03140 [Verrucomicrobiae bacterium]|nr:hypothetical protein [Verrucomicrobiae bacterium]
MRCRTMFRRCAASTPFCLLQTALLLLLSFRVVSLGQTSTPPPYPLEILWSQDADPGSCVWRVSRKPGPADSGSVAHCRVVTARHWPAGLVPVFAVESEGRISLRRMPPSGDENFSDPLFFALPPEDEAEAARLAGRWDLESRSLDGRQHRLAMEWSVLGEQAAGRLDQESDFRFAYLTGATWRENHLQLTVEYIADRYEMRAVWTNGVLRGTWKQVPEGDEGAWEAVRPPQGGTIPPADGGLALYEWRRDSGAERRYTLGNASSGEGWKREPRPLCRVWPLAR